MVNQKEKSFEQCIIDYELALTTLRATDLMAATIELLDGVNTACSQGGLVEKGASPAAIEHWYTRAAAALTQFITNPNTRITGTDLPKMTLRKQTVAYIFNASGFRHMGHLVDLIKDFRDDGQVIVNKERAAVLMVFINLDNVSDALMDVALCQPPEFLLHLMLGWLNQRAVLTTQGEKNRGRLLTSGHLLESASISDSEIPALVNAWMYSSYATDPNKHAIKIWFNYLLRKRMNDANVIPRAVVYSPKKRPKILVIHERFLQQHAMFRCYAPMLRTLGNYFEMVALADGEMIDDAAEDIFDEVVRLPKPRPSIDSLMETIQTHAPDMIYYPSLGMSYWTVMLAALRLAPIQIMTHGHPATSMLDTVDYVYVGGDMQGDLSEIHSERIINSSTNIVFEAHSALPTELPQLLPPSPREVRIAVNSKVMKLSWRLMAICKRLAQESQIPVRFSFFPGERLAYMDGLDAAIRAHLPSAKVVPYVDYVSFLTEMCQCDFALAAFPFGNTNSTVDTCMLGLPTVAHVGLEVPAQSDRMVLNAAGLPDWLVCDNDEDYFQTALRLINEPSARVEAMGGYDRDTLRQRLVQDNAHQENEPFGEVLFKLHRNFEVLSSSEKRVFDYTEIQDMSG